MDFDFELGYEYVVEGKENIEDFAKSILLLTNLRSNFQGIIDFRTHYETNDITIIADTKNDDYIKRHIGSIKEKKEIKLINLQNEDLQRNLDKELNKMMDNDVEYFVHTNDLV